MDPRNGDEEVWVDEEPPRLGDGSVAFVSSLLAGLLLVLGLLPISRAADDVVFVFLVLAPLVGWGMYRVLRWIFRLIGLPLPARLQASWLLTWLPWFAAFGLMGHMPFAERLATCLAFGAGAAAGHFGLRNRLRIALRRRRPAVQGQPAQVAAPDTDLEALLESAREDVDEVQDLARAELADDSEIDAPALVRNAKANLAEAERLATRVGRLRRVLEAQPDQPRVAARFDRGYDRLVALTQAIEEAAAAARAYASGQQAASGLRGQARLLERLVASQDELDEELGTTI